MLISTVSVCYVTQHFIVDHVTNPTNRIERLRITLRNEILLVCDACFGKYMPQYPRDFDCPVDDIRNYPAVAWNSFSRRFKL